MTTITACRSSTVLGVVSRVALAAVAVLSVGLLVACGDDRRPGPTGQAAASASASPVAGAAAALGAAPSPSATARPADASAAVCTTTVSSAAALASAAGQLRSGTVVCLNPGTYRLTGRIVLRAGQSGTAAKPAVIRSRDGARSVLLDAAGAEEAIYFSGARHVVLDGLRITHGAYHAVKIDPPSSDLLIRNTAMYDNFAAADNAQYSAVKGCCKVARVTLERNEIYYTKPGPGSNQQGIDCNGCKSWVVRGNRIHGIRSMGESGAAVQFKSGSADTVIDSNVIYGNFLGISFGGFGNPQEWGGEEYEHVRGIVRNNVVYGNVDAGISVINTKDGKVYNNTLVGNGFTPDVRVKAVNLDYRNNILDRALNLRDGTTAVTGGNYVLPSPTSTAIFVGAATGNYRPKGSASSVVGKGQHLGKQVTYDAAGIARPSGAYDIGAYQH